jgi:hypothetical protein
MEGWRHEYGRRAEGLGHWNRLANSHFSEAIACGE